MEAAHPVGGSWSTCREEDCGLLGKEDIRYHLICAHLLHHTTHIAHFQRMQLETQFHHWTEYRAKVEENLSWQVGIYSMYTPRVQCTSISLQSSKSESR